MSLLLLFQGAAAPRPPNLGGTGGGAGIRSGTHRTRSVYRHFRFVKPDELTAEEIREAASEFRQDVQQDPLSKEVELDRLELSHLAKSLSNTDRLSDAVAVLSRAVSYAVDQRKKAEAAQREQSEDDEAAAALLLS